MKHIRFKPLKMFLFIFILKSFMQMTYAENINKEPKKKKEKFINVYVNERFRTTLLFPKQLQQVFLGNNEEFLNFEMNRTSESYGNRIISLQYNREGVEEKTNLTVVTDGGNVYEFLLTYIAGVPDPLTMIIKENQAMGNISNFKTPEMVTVTDTIMAPKALKTDSNDNISFVEKALKTTNIHHRNILKEKKLNQKLLSESRKQIKEQNVWVNPQLDLQMKEIAKIRGVSMHVLKERQGFGGRYAQFNNQGMAFELLYVGSYENHLYLKVVIRNNTGIPYKIGFIKYSISIGKTSKNTTTQEKYIDPVLTNLSPKVIEAEEEHEFVAVFETQAMDEKKGLEVQIWEAQGERNLGLFISSEIINQPEFLSKEELRKYAH